MLDVRLISILPQQPANQGVTPPGTISQGSSSNAPVISINLPAGSILSGFIINRDIGGNPILRTESGDITFQTQLFLKIGTEVVLRIGSRGGAPTANIVSINGQPPPPATAPAQPHFAAEPEVIVDPAVRPQAAQPVQQSVLPAPPSAATAQTATPSAPQTPVPVVTGTLLPKIPSAENIPLTFRVVTVIPPAAAPATAPVTLTPSAPPAATAAPPTASSITAAATSPLPSLTPGQVVTAQVVQQDPTGEALVQTPAGIVRLQNVSLPPGGRVTLEVLPQTAPLASAGATLPPAPLPELARQWVSLQQIATLLATRPDAMPLPWAPVSNPAQPPPATPTPQTFSTGLMFFIVALRGGDFRNWLGENNVRWLQQNGHDALVRKAEAEFFTLARAFTDAPAQSHQWQSVFFPVAMEGQLQQVRMFLKRDRRNDKGGKAKKDDDTRFIVELSMSQLGEMQMDGLVRRHPEQPVEFDLFIRSLVPLTPDMQQEIMVIYNSMGELTGYKGSLVFQAVKEFPVNPMKEAMTTAGSVVA